MNRLKEASGRLSFTYSRLCLNKHITPPQELLLHKGVGGLSYFFSREHTAGHLIRVSSVQKATGMHI